MYGPSATACGSLCASVLHKYSSHLQAGQRIKVSATFNSELIVVDESEICFVDQRCCLQGVPSCRRSPLIGRARSDLMKLVAK